ncbi:MAG TPA: hypothetical protein VHY75_02940 [Steroidobacteraceae bacterium]|jgi:hypothetical protein|nr:hypothetical protein [Steroidobacteraceae bacterium]
MSVRITAELTAEPAAALARVCEKFAHGEGKATAAVYEALREAGISTRPLLDTGVAS